MGYEIDFLPVGDGERSGDAIALRFGNLHGSRNEQVVIIIDGGFTDSGTKLVEHIGTYYRTDTADLVVCTHPDADHAAGLHVVLEEMRVGCLLMHQPWNHTDQIARMLDGRVTDASVSAALRRSLETVRSLETLAKRKSVQIVEPFEGTYGWDRRFLVVGPSLSYYESLLPLFQGTPEPKPSLPLGGLLGALEFEPSPSLGGLATPPPRSSLPLGGLLATLGPGAPPSLGTILGGSPEPRPSLLSGGLLDALAMASRSKHESWGVETLDGGDGTRAENNSGTVILVTPEPGHRLLFTADTGVPALSNAIKALDRMGFDYSELRFVQVPHHGSRHNVDPATLDRLLGPKQLADVNRRTAFVSASKDAPKHPSPKVTNAFRRRGAWVYATEGLTKWHHHDAPHRLGWYTAVPIQFDYEAQD